MSSGCLPDYEMSGWEGSKIIKYLSFSYNGKETWLTLVSQQKLSKTASFPAVSVETES